MHVIFIPSYKHFFFNCSMKNQLNMVHLCTFVSDIKIKDKKTLTQQIKLSNKMLINWNIRIFLFLILDVSYP